MNNAPLTDEPPTSGRGEPRSTMRYMFDFVAIGLTVAAAWFLWPAFLGGSSRLITVQGHSMEPTYASGDLVLLDTGATPEVGDIIVFRISEGEPGAGQLVVHRIIDRREDGTYITQGDNSDNPDTFLTTSSDILGSPRVVVPHGATAIGLLSSPIGLGVATGGLCTALLWPRKRDETEGEFEEPEEPARELSPKPPAAPSAVAALDQQVTEDDIAAEAEAWLREQIALIGRAE